MRLRVHLLDVHFLWRQHRELFGTKPARIELLNQTAPVFFGLLEDVLWEYTLLAIARLNDPTHSPGAKSKPNLTVAQLPVLVPEGPLRDRLTHLVQEASSKAAFAIDWRNRRIAHRALLVRVDEGAKPLAPGSALDVQAALAALAAVMWPVEQHYLGTETVYDPFPIHGDAQTLLYVLRDGRRLEDLRRSRLEAGHYDPDLEDQGEL